MAYNDTPLPTDTPAQSQNPMRQNFQQIATSYNTDHVPLSAGSNVGYSNKDTLVSQGSDPGAVAAAGIIYTKTPTSHTELFYKGESGTGKILQMTNQSLTASAGEGFTPGGLQVRCGVGGIPAGSPGTLAVTYGVVFPNNTIAVAVSVNNANTIVQTDRSSYSASGFTAAANSGGGTNFAWIAVGY